MANINDLGRLIANAVKAGLQDIGGGGGGGAVVNTSNTVMARPVFTNLTQGPGGPVPPYGAGNVINPPFANTGGGSGGRPSFAGLGGSALAGTLSMMPGALQANFVNYITTRAGSFSGMAPSGAQGQGGLFGPMPGDERTGQYNYMSQLMRNMARTGTVTNAMDIPAAIANMQYRYNFSGPGAATFMTGAAAMSNLTPGAGVERSSASMFGAFMDPTRQNRMRMLGMSVTDAETGMPKDPRTIADQIWNRLNMQKMGSKAISREDIQRSLLPGRSLDSMLNMLVGDDPLARNQIATLLMAKAMSGGASAYDVTTKESLLKLGVTTEGMLSASNRAAAELQGVQSVARAETYGLTKANEAAAILAETLSRLNSQFGFATPGAVGAGFLDTIKGAFGFGGASTRAKGGDVASKNAYLVGEAGPELFVPNASGYVVPNHELRFAGARHDGGYVHPHPHPEWSKKDLDSEGRLSTSKVREILGHVGFKGNQVDNAMQIIGKESARRPGALNPHGKDLSYGLFQINMLGDLGPDRRKRFGLSSNDILYDPLKNAMVGYEMSNQGTNWNAWSTAEGLGLKSGKGSTGGGSTTSITNSTPESGGFWQSALNSISSVAKGLFGASAMGQVINYGGVRVDVILPKGSSSDAKGIAKEVIKIIDHEQLQKRAKGN